MKKNATAKNLRILTFCAMLTAISVVLGIFARQFLTFNIGVSLRITFENMTIVLAGVVFGPLWGGIVGIASDLLSSIVTAQSINTLITLGAGIVGVVSGIVFLVCKKRENQKRTIITAEFAAQIIGSIIVKTIGISVMYSAPFWVTLLYRTANYLPICVIEAFVLILVLRNKSVRELIDKTLNKA